MRYFLEFSYLGTAFSGWKSLPENQGLGIQTVFEDALGKLLREPAKLTAAGRTDTGVHAEQMFAHFDCTRPIACPQDFCRHLNGILPPDIAIRRVFQVREQAHARFDASRRQYKYFLHTRKDPFRRQTSYYYPYSTPLDLPAMNRACGILREYEDFQCFSKVETDVKTFLCRVEEAHWDSPEPHRLVFTITADRFLRNMVRAIVGTMLEIGRGKRSPESLRGIIESHDRRQAGMSAPAQGLFLWQVEYPWENILP